MTHILVKSGRVVVQGGRVLTSQDGAPCCCGPGGSDECYLILLRCNCNDLTQSVAVGIPTVLDQAWPYQDRRAGVVVEFGSTCYRFIAATTNLPDGIPMLDVADFTGNTYASCEESPCAGEPECECTRDRHIVTVPGFFGIYYACMPNSTEVCGIDFVEYTVDRSARMFIRGRTGSGGDCNYYELHNIALNYTTSYSQQVGHFALSGSGSSSGIETRCGTNVDGPYTYQEWDLHQQYTDADLVINGGDATNLIQPNYSMSTYNELLINGPPGTRTALPMQVGRVWDCCCRTERREDTPSGEDYTLASSRGFQNATRTRFSATYEKFNSWPGPTRYFFEYQISLSINRVWTLSNGWLIEDEDCDRPPFGIAVACDAQADPPSVVFDPLLIPEGITHVRPLTQGSEPDAEIYYLTGQVTELEPDALLPTETQCPEPPNPTNDVYRINICNSTTRAGGAVVEGDVLIPKVIGYRPGDGLQPGEGMVWANIPVPTSSGNVCLRRVACQPTTQVVTDAEIEYTSVPGNCRGQPVANVDPRQGCAGPVDGGGGVGPSDTLGLNAPQDPALQAELDRQAAMRTGQFPGRCPSCGG